MKPTLISMKQWLSANERTRTLPGDHGTSILQQKYFRQ